MKCRWHNEYESNVCPKCEELTLEIKDEVEKKYMPLTLFLKRMKRLKINVQLSSNYPWIYMESINGRRVKDKFRSDHKFTIAFAPIRKDQIVKFTDISETFKIIRKYK